MIAAVAGFALGGGCELAMQCDLIIAADTAKFGQPEIKLGVIPGIGGTQRLTHAVGKAKAMDLCLTGRMMDAAEAERGGLVARVVPAASLMDEAMKVADTIASMSLPALMVAKEAVNSAFEMTLAEGIRFERRTFQALFATMIKKKECPHSWRSARRSFRIDEAKGEAERSGDRTLRPPHRHARGRRAGSGCAQARARAGHRCRRAWRSGVALSGGGGCRHAGCVDDDVVSLSNLQRQVIHATADIGRPKVESAAAAVERSIRMSRWKRMRRGSVADNALDLIARYDLVADGSDNFETRYLVADACYFAKKPLVTAAVGMFDGTLTTIRAHERGAEGRPNPSYRCLFPEPPPPGTVPLAPKREFSARSPACSAR